MVGSSTDTHGFRVGQSPSPISLVNWPLLQDGLRAWAMAATLVVVSAIASHVSANLVMGIVVGGALAASAWRLWIPVRFEISSKGITERVLGLQRRIPWTEFARYDVRRRGVLLFTEHDATPLAAFRCLYVRWNRHREDLLELLDFFVKPRSELQVATTQTYQPE